MTEINFMTGAIPPQVLKDNLSVANAWNAFAAAVLPVNASQLQREEMRKAFFGGFSECFAIVQHVSEKLPEEEAAALLGRLNDELADFVKRLRSL